MEAKVITWKHPENYRKFRELTKNYNTWSDPRANGRSIKVSFTLVPNPAELHKQLSELADSVTSSGRYLFETVSSIPSIPIGEVDTSVLVAAKTLVLANWYDDQELEGTNSLDIPVEYMELRAAVCKYYNWPLYGPKPEGL